MIYWVFGVSPLPTLMYCVLVLPIIRMISCLKASSIRVTCLNGVVDGIGSYGNSIGIPTVNGATVFDDDYTGNVLVYAGCIGVLPKDQYIRNVQSW